jgi:16S rRNA (guanine(966)-N(2))-methyltransferase RsmD
MNVRIISGRFGKRKIKAPEGSLTRPMGERIRGALFNMIATELPGARVLDAFAGTGSLGIEAISRGAESCVFVEKNRKPYAVLKDNLEMLGLGDDEVKATKVGLGTWITAHKEERFDIIFVDPPYNNLQLSTVKQLFRLLKPNGLMVLSTPGRCEVPTDNQIVVVDNRSYGTAALTFYRRKSA